MEQTDRVLISANKEKKNNKDILLASDTLFPSYSVMMRFFAIFRRSTVNAPKDN